MLLEDARKRDADALAAQTKIELAGITALTVAMQGEGAVQGRERVESAMAQAMSNLASVISQPQQVIV
jgi:hypothetical protein